MLFCCDCCQLEVMSERAAVEQRDMENRHDLVQQKVRSLLLMLFARLSSFC